MFQNIERLLDIGFASILFLAALTLCLIYQQRLEDIKKTSILENRDVNYVEGKLKSEDRTSGHEVFVMLMDRDLTYQVHINHRLVTEKNAFQVIADEELDIHAYYYRQNLIDRKGQVVGIDFILVGEKVDRK